MKVLYTAVVKAEGGRYGRVSSDDGRLDLALSVPPGMGGTGDGSNPEQLFAAAYAACFGSAVGAAANQEGLDATGSTITARVSIGRTDSGEYRLSVVLQGFFPLLTEEEGLRLMETAHVGCPYSNATRGNVDVTLSMA